MVSDRLLTRKQMTQRKTKEIRREEILAAALRLFADNGYAATSMRDLAAAVALTEGALYKHFAGKQELFEATIDRVIGLRDQMLVQSIEMDMRNIRAVLTFLGRAVLQFITEGEGQYVFRIFVQEPHLAMSPDGPSVRDRFLQGLNLLTSLFEAARVQGVLRPDVNAQYAARQFGGTLISTAVIQKIVGLDATLPLDRDAFVDQLVEVFMSGAVRSDEGVK